MRVAAKKQERGFVFGFRIEIERSHGFASLPCGERGSGEALYGLIGEDGVRIFFAVLLELRESFGVTVLFKICLGRVEERVVVQERIGFRAAEPLRSLGIVRFPRS